MRPMIETLADIIAGSAARSGASNAIRHKSDVLTYDELLDAVRRFSANVRKLGLRRDDRVAIYAGKRPQTVVAAFGTSHAGGVFVPVNALLRPQQVAYILNDCDVRILVTTSGRYAELAPVLPDCRHLQSVVIMDDADVAGHDGGPEVVDWSSMSLGAGAMAEPRVIASDMAAIMYTSGSTGSPKGVVLSHLNMTLGAESVAHYLGNSPRDKILSALPLSFDAGLSQLTTGFFAGATVVLHDYFLPRDIVRIIERERITGLTGVPPLWMQLAEQKWPDGGATSLRYFANTGGKMPRETLAQLRKIFPNAEPFLMYGLTESFRSTFLPPSEVDSRPDSIGKAIPNAEVLVVAKDGSICKPGETGELVHRGPLVSLGYWNDPERTAHRFRPVPGRPSGLPLRELAVWSGDAVRTDEDGYLYFVGRLDDMIKTSGYRVSPAEVEEVVFDSGLVSEAAALGIPHRRLGQGIVLVAKPKNGGDTPTEELLNQLRERLPTYMLPLAVHWRDSLPRNANGKLDRRHMADEFADAFREEKS